MTTTFACFIDWDNTGDFSTAGDNITADIREIPLMQIGSYLPFDRVASVGTCTLLLDNTSRNYSPLNAAGTHYNKLLPGLPMKIEATSGGTTWVIFRGVTMRWMPTAGLENRTCVLDCADMLFKLQSNTVSLPFQEGKSADYLIKLIASQIYGTAAATGQIYLNTPATNDTLTVGTQVYRFVTALAQANDVLIGATYLDTAGNLCDAIHTAPKNSGTTYHASTTKHADLSGAILMDGTGYDDSFRDVGLILQGTGGTTNIKLAQSFQLPAAQTVSTLNLSLRKSGSPTGTVTLRIETDSAGLPSGTLANANATLTFAESTCDAGTWVWKSLSFGTAFTLSAATTYHIVLSTDRAWDGGTNEISWGANNLTIPTYHNGLTTRNNGTIWSAYSPDTDACFEIGAVVEVAALARGTWGNSIAMTTTSSAITLSGATLANGIDGPASLNDYAAGVGTFDVAADTWIDGETNGITAVSEVCQSEYGFFWAAPNGTLTFRPWSFLFSQANATPALTIAGTHTAQQGSISLDDVYNRIVVSYVPRNTLASGVICKANNIIKVEGRTGIVRWNKTYDHNGAISIPWHPVTDLRPADPGNTIVRLPYVDQTTGRISGAKNVINPVKTTDFRCWDQSDGAGFEYTNAPPIVYEISVVADGSGVDLTFKNTASGPLWFTDVQVRGQAIVSYDDQNVTYESQSSTADYGSRLMDYYIPLATTQQFADGLAMWLLAQFSVPKYRVQSISFRNTDAIGAVNLYSLVIGDVVALTEPTTGLSASAHMIIGISDMISAGGLNTDRTFTLLSFDSHNYFTLDDATYSVIDSVAVLSM